MITWTLKTYGTYWIEDEKKRTVPLTNVMNSYHLMNEAMVEAKCRGITHLRIVDEDGKVLIDQEL